MRVLLSTIGSRGDVQPLVALGRALKVRGHEVGMCVPPDFCDWVAEEGFAVTPMGPPLRGTATASPSSTPLTPPTPEQLRQRMEQMVALQFATLAEAARGCELLVGATALQLAAPSVAERYGIPYVFVAYCPAVLPSRHHAPPVLGLLGDTPEPARADYTAAWEADAARWNAQWRSVLDAQRAALDLAPVDDVRRYVLTARPWLAADPVLAPWPERADVVQTGGVIQTGAWLLSDERPLPVELEAFLDAGEPPVYVGFGSVRAPADASRVVIEAARSLGRRVIVSRGWGGLSLIDDGADCLAIDEVDHSRLFRRVAAVVHHGGAGTTTSAARAGAPQVVVPQQYDQHYWARRVDELGIGAAHAPGTPTAVSLAEVLERALRPDVVDRARAIASAVRGDGVEVAAERLVRMSAADHAGRL